MLHVYSCVICYIHVFTVMLCYIHASYIHVILMYTFLHFSLTSLGLPPVIKTTWRQLYIDNIKLRRRWRLGQAQTLPLTNHTHRILCIRIKENEEICASGSGDRTINLWRLTDGKLINTLHGHTVRQTSYRYN